MSDLPQINSVSHRHDAIINWLVSHPDRPLGDCAAFFGYTQPWLSRIIHSDMFQAAYRKRAEELGVEVIHTMKDKLLNLAAISVEASTKRIENGLASEKFLGETLKNSLAALGYGAPQAVAGAAAQSNVHVHLDAASVIQAREEAAARRAGTTPVKLEQVIEIPSSSQVTGLEEQRA